MDGVTWLTPHAFSPSWSIGLQAYSGIITVLCMWQTKPCSFLGHFIVVSIIFRPRNHLVVTSCACTVMASREGKGMFRSMLGRWYATGRRRTKTCSSWMS